MRVSKYCQFLAAVLSLWLAAAPAAAASLADRVAFILKQNGLAESRMSIKIVSLPDGRVLYAKDPGQGLNPASNIKLITMAAALRTLGPDYTFPTEFYAPALIDKNGRIPNLWIKGYGDPLFVSEELEDLVRRFKSAGLKRIDGDVFVDDTYYDRNNLTTYIADVNEKLYSIMTGPLSFNFNSIRIQAKPSRRPGGKPAISIDPPTRYVTVENEAKTSWAGANVDLDAEVKEARPRKMKKETNVIRIRGTIPNTIREFNFQRGVPDPAIYTGTVILEALERHGITVKGALRREAVPASALLLFTHSSKPLRVILKSLGKFSNNFTAEQLVKAMAAKRFGPPGSIPMGLKVLRDYVESLGVPGGIPGNGVILDNGSGLTRLSSVAADDFIRLLYDLYVSPWRDDFIASLAIGGVDGTLARKFKGGRLTGKMYAKTGTLNDVKALSGYVFDDKARLAFSFLFNEFDAPMDNIARAQEEILETILDSL